MYRQNKNVNFTPPEKKNWTLFDVFSTGLRHYFTQIPSKSTKFAPETILIDTHRRRCTPQKPPLCPDRSTARQASCSPSPPRHKPSCLFIVPTFFPSHRDSTQGFQKKEMALQRQEHLPRRHIPPISPQEGVSVLPFPRAFCA